MFRVIFLIIIISLYVGYQVERFYGTEITHKLKDIQSDLNEICRHDDGTKFWKDNCGDREVGKNA